MLFENSHYNVISENLSIDKEKKEIYGEINTPFYFIEKMFDLFPQHVFENETLIWLDPGCGGGNFSICLYFRLMKGLLKKIPNPNDRSKHIIEKMIYMCEINIVNVERLKRLFGKTANIIFDDFISISPSVFPRSPDIIIGNPPFNINGSIKVPTNNNKVKKTDGSNAWIHFIRKSLSILKQNGYLNVIIPSIWMKPDKEKMYYLLTNNKIHFIHTLSNTETNKLFSYGAQTPTCYFLLEKKESDNEIGIYDQCQRDYIKINLNPEMPIALSGWSILKKMMPFCEKYGNLYNDIIKTNMPPKNAILINESKYGYYKNIHSCVLEKNKPTLSIKYSENPLIYQGVSKLVLAHKMYGFPYIDLNGEYGISNRDNYILINKTKEELLKLQKGLHSKIIFFIMTTTRYRMKYLEKYAFYYIPDFSRVEDIDQFYKTFLGSLNTKEKDLIDNIIKNNYISFK